MAAASAPIPVALPTPRPDVRVVEVQPAAVQAETPVPGSTEPIRPHLVRTFAVRAGTAKSVESMSLLSPEPIAVRSPMTAMTTASAGTEGRGAATDSLPPPPPGARPGVLGVLSSKDLAQPPMQPTRTASVAPIAPAAPVTAVTAPAAAAERSAASGFTVADRKPRSSGWIIQVGAFEARDEAREKLADAKSRAGNLLKGAEPYTEVFSRGDKRFYRARFAGLKESDAERACRELKKSRIACFTSRN